MARRTLILGLLIVGLIVGCKTVFETVRGKSFVSINSSDTDLLKGVVPRTEIDPNFVKMRVADFDLSHYPESLGVHLLVMDERGNFIPALAPPHEHFKDWREHWNEVMERYDEETMVKRFISEYSVTEIGYQDRPPLAIGLVLDYSGEMKGKTVELEYLTETILFLKRDVDYLSILKYDDLPVTEVQPTTDKKLILDQFKRDGIARFGKKRATYTACMEGIGKLSQIPAEKVLFLFTSGPDDASSRTMHDVIQKARDTGVRMFIVGTDRQYDSLLSFMGKYTLGAYRPAESMGEVEGLFEDMARSLYNYYHLRYKPPIHFGEHLVRVQILLPDASNEAFTRASYNAQGFDPYSPVGTAMPLMIQYDFNRAVIREESFPLLDLVATRMKQLPSLRVEIRGHTDLAGKEDYNQKLSEQRAVSVKQYIVDAGVDPNRLSTSGMGSSIPVAPNDTETNRQLNRRTEFVITGR